MAHNPWVPAPRNSNEEIEDEIQKFLDNGGEIIKIDDTYNSTKKNSDTAVKIGELHVKLRATGTKE